MGSNNYQLPLIIIGAPCGGKTSVCRELSSSYVVLDLDLEIQRKEGLSPSEIISSKGVREFRNLELGVLKDVLESKKPYDVISLGGGAIETKEVRELISGCKKVGLVADVSTLVDRAKQDVKHLRPLLGKKEDEIAQNLSSLFSAREEFYRESNLFIYTDFAKAKDIAAIICDLADCIDSQMQLTTIPFVSKGSDRSVILIGEGACEVVKNYSISNHDPRDVLVFIDENLKSKTSEILDELLEFKTDVIASGESSKSMAKLENVLDRALLCEISRKGAFFAVGGGVIGDLVGLAASMYLRGVSLYQIPSTVVSMVDSSVGGKTGINRSLAKNSIGAFYPAQFVACEPKLLSSLPEREFISGLAEVIKYGCIADGEFFFWLQSNADKVLSREPESIKKIIEKSVRIKASCVYLDLYDRSGMRALLNFGHTLAHALESTSNYQKYLHGEAVSIGMHFAGILGEKMHVTQKGFAEKLEAVLLKYKLPTYSFKTLENIETSELMGALIRDKKRSGDEINYVFVKKMGSAGNFKVKISSIVDILSSMC